MLVAVNRRWVFIVVGLWVLAHAPEARAWELPPVSGRVAGELKLLRGAAVVAWEVEARSIGDGRRSLELAAHADGLALRLAMEVDAVTGEGTWRVVQGNVDLACWCEKLGPKLPSALSGMTAEGVVELSGEGKIVQGHPVGKISFLWREGAVQASEMEVRLDGVTVSGEVDVASPTTGKVPVTLSIKTISTARFGARNLEVRAVLNGLDAVDISSAEVEIAGGTVKADPFTVPLSPPDVTVKLQMSRVGLQDVVALVPETGLADARGRIDGDIVLGWSEVKGLQIGEGRLALHRDEPTTLRLAAAPGFLTGQMPAKFGLLPDWMGPLARWLSFDNPAYADLSEIELGQMNLIVDSFETRITPDGDNEGRSAKISVRARPARAGSVVEQVTFEINVAGPIGDLIRIGLNQPVSFSFH